MKKIRLAIVRTSAGSLDTSAYNIQEIGLAKGLLNFNISTDIYSKFKDIKDITVIDSKDEFNIRLIPLKGIVILGKITYFPGLIKKLTNYDIVQVHEDSQLMTPLILIACRKQSIKTILYQGMYTNYSKFNRLYQIIFDFIFKAQIQRNSKYILAKTEFAQKYLINKGYRNVNVLPVGLDLKKNIIKCSLDKEILTFKSDFQYVLLYVGKIESRRNPLFLIDILYSLKELGLNVGLIVVGDGPLKISMVNYAHKKSVMDQLLLITSIPNNEIYDVFKKSDVVLLPSNNEIYGMVVLEALLNGIPVIATPEAGPISILQNKILGTCLPLNVDNWVNAIQFYFRNTQNQRNKLYRIRSIMKNYNWEFIANKYYKLIVENENSSNK